jgi:hypothetical protein
MKKIKFISTFLLLFTMVTFTSCDNEPIDSAIDLDDFNNGGGNNGGNTGVYTATIGDDSFSAEVIVAEYSDSAFGPELNIAGIMQNGKTMNIQIINPAIGTRAANTEFSTLLFFQYSSSLNDVYSSINSSTNSSTGTITITDFNLTTKKISGTFSFTGYGALNSATQKQITNGVFTNISFEDTTTPPPAGIAGTYLLTAFNTSVPTDINNDGTSSTNQLNETTCFDDMLLVLNANNTFTANSKGIEIVFNGTVEEVGCFSDPNVTGTWVLNSNTLSLTYTDVGVEYTDDYIVNGNTISATAADGEIVGTETGTGAPVYLTSDITIVYTKQ